MIGSNDKQYVGFRRFMHYIFQYPFRKIAKKFLNFDAVNKTAKDILTEVGKGYSMDVLRQVISLAYLNDKKVVREGGTSCVIGDGYATMSSLLLKNKRQRVVLVNLSKKFFLLQNPQLMLEERFVHRIYNLANNLHYSFLLLVFSTLQNENTSFQTIFHMSA